MAANKSAKDASRFCNGLPVDVALDDKTLFAKHCLLNYIEQGSRGYSLSEFFTDGFREYSIDNLKSIESDTFRNVQNLLHNRRVYVPKRCNVIIADALYQVAHEDLSWPDDDPEKPIDKKKATSSTVVTQIEVTPPKHIGQHQEELESPRS